MEPGILRLSIYAFPPDSAKVLVVLILLTAAALLCFAIPKLVELIAASMPSQLRAAEERNRTLLREIRERKEMFERFFHSAPDAVLVTDHDGTITDANRQAELMFGYRQEELIGQAIEMLVPERMRGGHSHQRSTYMSAPKLRPMGQGLELFATRRDGSELPVDITLSPLHADGQVRVLAAIRDISERRLVQEKLRESLREKEVLLQEIHHRVKNNLAVICSLFYLESTYTKDEYTAQIFRESAGRVHSMALVHEALYESGDLSRINFGEYARGLAVRILSSHGTPDDSAKIKLSPDLKPVFLTIDSAVPCGLIMNELITNAMRHGFPPGSNGELRLTVRDDGDGSILLEVADNGRGLPPDFQIDTRKSLGLRLVQSLSRQLRGRFELLATSPGTSARLKFPQNQALTSWEKTQPIA